MKLTTTTFVSDDGVMQGIGAADEDRSGGSCAAVNVTMHSTVHWFCSPDGVVASAPA